MIERIRLEQLEFTEFKELKNKEKEMKYCSLRDAFEKVFPLFSEIYELSKSYDSRAKFAEDERYINKRMEIGEILLKLRNSYKTSGFEDNDYEFINELLDKWNELTKNFPVFGGDASRLYLFWFLSFLDILENIFYSDVKIISFVDLFFFEKILDYILSEKGEEQAEKEELFRVFERFKPPIDHYRALNLVLSHLRINNKEVRCKLFEFYDSLIPKLKNKVNYSNLLLTKANHLIKQEEYKAAFEFLEKNKSLILKERPIEWISKIAQIKREDYETGEKINELFGDKNFIETIVKIVPEEELYEFSLMLLYKLELENKSVVEFLNEILDEGEEKVFFSGNYNLLLRRRWGCLKERDFIRAEKLMGNFGEQMEKYLPFEYTKFKISYLKISGRLREAEKLYNDSNYIGSLFKKAKSRKVQTKLSILILAEVNIFNKKVQLIFLEYLYSIKITKDSNKELIFLYIKALLNQGKTKTVYDIADSLISNFQSIPAKYIMELLFFLHWNFDVKEIVRSHENLTYYLIKHTKSFFDNKKLILLLRELVFNIWDEETLKNEFSREVKELGFKTKKILPRGKKITLTKLEHVKTVFKLEKGILKVCKIDMKNSRLWVSAVLNNNPVLIETGKKRITKTEILDYVGFFNFYNSDFIVTKKFNELLIIRRKTWEIVNKITIDSDFREIVTNGGIFVAGRFSNIIYHVLYSENRDEIEIKKLHYDYPSNEIKRIFVFENTIYLIGTNSSKILIMDIKTNVSKYINIEVEPVFIWTSFYIDSSAFYLSDFFGHLYKIGKDGKIIYKLIIDDRITSMDKYNNDIFISLKNNGKIIKIDELQLGVNS